MFKTNRLLRGTILLTFSQVANYTFSFARNVLLARVLTKADVGLAAIFGMTLSLLEVAGRMSFGHQIIQSKDGDSESFQETSQAFQFILSVLGAFLMLALCQPLAHAFKVPQLTFAFALLAGVPLARGFEHLDYFRQQRALNYLPSVLCELVPQAVVTLAAWPLALWLGDFRVIVWLMLGKAALGIFMTHWMAERSYRWALQKDYVKAMWLFGWPLLLNGLLMFGAQQADQVIVGAFLSLNELATYALVLSLVSIPWFIFGQVGSSIMLPILSKDQGNSEQFRQRYRACVEYASVGAVVLTVPLIVAGEQLITLLFGAKYSGAGILMALLGAASAVRFLRFVPSVAATSRADTKNHLYSNLWRSLSLPLAATVALLGGGVPLIATCALVAELMAAVGSLLRLRLCQGVPMRDTLRAAAYVLGFVTTELILVFCVTRSWPFWPTAMAMLAFLALSILMAWAVFPDLARMLAELSGRKWSSVVEQPSTSSIL